MLGILCTQLHLAALSSLSVPRWECEEAVAVQMLLYVASSVAMPALLSARASVTKQAPQQRNRCGWGEAFLPGRLG